MFAYCGNNPVNRIDPLGEAWWHYVIRGIISAALNVFTSWASSKITGQDYTFWDGFGDAIVGALAGGLEDGRKTVAIISAVITFIESVADGDEIVIVVLKTAVDGILSYASFGGFLELDESISDFLIAEFVDLALLYGPELGSEALFEAFEEEKESIPMRYCGDGPYIVRNHSLNGGRAVYMTYN